VTSLRTVLETVGIAAVVVALLFVFEPGLAGGLSVPQVALSLLGVLALIEGVRSVQKRRHTAVDSGEPPTPEVALDTPMPGEEFDRALANRRLGATRTRRRLSEAAADTIALREDVSPDEAERRVADGVWTDDPVAASYLGGSHVPRPPWRIRLRLTLGGRDSRPYFVERTVAAIAARWEDE